ncbi:MAG: hypothetical protein ACR2OE_12385 [Thermomicrobiales bacterium]
MPKQTKPIAVGEDTPADPAATLATLRTLRRELKQTVLDTLASWLALPAVLRTTERYFRDVLPVPFDLASLGLTTCVGTDADGLWVIQIRGEIAHHGIRVSQAGPSLAFTVHQCAERAYERIDRLIAEIERDRRREAAEIAA